MRIVSWLSSLVLKLPRSQGMGGTHEDTIGPLPCIREFMRLT
jgi:hypothetical protein